MNGWRYVERGTWSWWSPDGNYVLEIVRLSAGWMWYGCHCRDGEAAGGLAESKQAAKSEAQAWMAEHTEYHREMSPLGAAG